MKASRIKYFHINFYKEKLDDLKFRNQEFSLTETSYSKKIQTKDAVYIFNEDGGSDYDILSIINSVRRNAQVYLEKHSYEQREKTYIHFYDLFRKPKSDEVIWKVDIKSAYWEAALKRGVVDEMTNAKLLEVFEGRPAKEMKRARLKALGSLATTKKIRYYKPGENGKSVLDDSKGKNLNGEEIITEHTKDIYMDICRDVDTLMRECVSENQTIIYYYWDCIFVPKNTGKEVIDFFKKRDYNVSVEETKLEYIDLFRNGGGFLLSMSDNKAYMVRKESIGLLQEIGEWK